MFTLSFTSVAVILIVAWIFRRPIKTLTTEMPEVVSNLIAPAVKATAQLDPIVSVNILENDVRLIKRATIAAKEIEAQGNENVMEIYNRLKAVKTA